ncbi:LysR family transcriptional regulator [Ruegeria marisrubri]|uniref:HTH-type transcriptional regulator CbbR n=1 Tax=Ruegeria marisrubri TaxID=1685379 RepID=A0A0X3UBL7_9RHOB|nr:LysR substrate-binding domain-containing protein [Ruegeria marisrubri]KUJ85477.1 LysR family transcriptional regulator [Ruegeria marisrubri]
MTSLAAVTLKQLRALDAVVRFGTMTAAAEYLGLTVPAIHSQIKLLEDLVDAPVLLRATGGGSAEPTEAGRVLLRAARLTAGILSQAENQLDALGRGKSGLVTLSVVSTAKYFAPRLVRMLRDRVVDIDVALRVGNRETIIADLAEARCDLAIMGRPPRDPLVEALPLGPHPHGVVLPANHALAGQDGYDPVFLMKETFLSREEGSGTRALMHRFLARFDEGGPPRIVEMDSNETIKQAVLAGLGIAFLSLHTVKDELDQGRLVALRGPNLPVMRHWYLVWPQQVALPPSGETILSEINQLNGAFLPRVAIS